MKDDIKRAITLLTCDRANYTLRVLESLRKYIDLDDFLLVYADDNSKDERVHEIARSFGFEPIFLNKQGRMGCSPMTDALWHLTRERIGGDGWILNCQNDFEAVRPLPADLIEEALYDDTEIACVKLWDRAVRGHMKGPRTRILKHGRWEGIEDRGEPCQVSRTGWGYGPHAAQANTLCRIVKNARKERGMMRQSLFLGKLVLRPNRLVFGHIGHVKTPDGKYFSKKRWRGHQECLQS